MTWLTILLVMVLVYLLYTLLPEILFHLWHIGSFHHGKSFERTLALTFDDGPDATFTPQVLDILKEHQTPATFFVVGSQAERHPVLISRMVAEGHQVAVHSHRHRHAFWLDPFSTWQDIRLAQATLSRLTGQPIHYYRPPWGAFNWVTRWACLYYRLTPVLWSLRAIDWHQGEYANQIAIRIVRGAQPGSIVLCHDAGGAPGAPKNMIEALPQILIRLKQLNFKFATVADLHETWLATDTASNSKAYHHYPLPRRALLDFWQLIEKLFTRTYHVFTLNAIFRISPTVWGHGIRRHPDTGEILLQNGSKAIDLHFQNNTLITASSTHDNRSLLRVLRMTRHSFQDIACVLLHHPDYQDTQVVTAFTLVNRGIETLGFHVEDLPDTFERRWLQRYMRFLMAIYHPDGFQRLHQGRHELTLKLVWMTRQEILDLYGPKADLQQTV